ncbi:DinB family protein [Desertivirga xinjiangensis]|uniref:DinB family protein n=1 Tax=Desertivirga xinjiangensis TaxID=539206 RepID=UPI00210DE077|nr:DinB family protein [Pedobacter xinjiangensis]
MKRPQADEYGSFYKAYIDLTDDDVIKELTDQKTSFSDLLRSGIERAEHAYAKDKWTLKELLGHVIDTERIMAYRLLCISRNEANSLPGFDQDDYVKYAGHNLQNFNKLIEEFELVRASNLLLIDSLTEEQLGRTGMANNYPMSARALLFIMAGHLKHHMKIIKERYLPGGRATDQI